MAYILYIMNPLERTLPVETSEPEQTASARQEKGRSAFCRIVLCRGVFLMKEP